MSIVIDPVIFISVYLRLMQPPVAPAARNGLPSAAIVRRITPVPSVPATDFLDSLSTSQSGYRRYEPRAVSLSGVRLEQSLLTEVTNIRPGEQLSTLTLLLNGEFDRFQATVGRDEREADRGRGYVYFEVWGDGRLLAKSAAIGAMKSPVGIGFGPDQPTKRGQMDLEAKLDGVLRLQLVTRYASDLPQRGRDMDRARGCLWGNARLTPAPGYIGNRANDPLRDALRLGALRLVAVALSALQRGESNLRQYPLSLGIAPLRPDGRGEENVPEPIVRAVLSELLMAAQQDKRPLFRIVDRNGSRQLMEFFPANRTEMDETEALLEIGKKAGADMVVTGSYSSGPEGKVKLTLVDTRTSQKFPVMEVIIASLRPIKAIRAK